MQERGKRLTCDRCGTFIFLKELKAEEQSRDGGYTRWNEYEYEDKPKGWSSQAFGNTLKDNSAWYDLCPKCTDIFNATKSEFLKPTNCIDTNDDWVVC